MFRAEEQAPIVAVQVSNGLIEDSGILVCESSSRPWYMVSVAQFPT